MIEKGLPPARLSKSTRRPAIRRVASALGWNSSSYFMMSAFALTLFLLGYIWWPLAEEYLSYIDWQGEWWRYMDWLLIGIFLFMSLTIMAHANLRQDAKIILIGIVGGLVIESWGTQTEIWVYYTNERPPLWIIPAWPIASLSIDRMVRGLRRWMPVWDEKAGIKTANGQREPSLSSLSARVPFLQNYRTWPNPYRIIYWLIFPAYYLVMIDFVAPTFDKSFTWIAVGVVSILILTPTDYRVAVLTFLAGAALGYFLELWGTTRACWTYYTHASPPVFAVLSHGLAAVAFWRGVLSLKIFHKTFSILRSRELNPKN